MVCVSQARMKTLALSISELLPFLVHGQLVKHRVKQTSHETK